VILELDFGMGNIRSLEKAFEHLGAPIRVSSNAQDIKNATALVLPGDGAFAQAMSEIKKRGMFEEIVSFVKSGRPTLGICIGFQVLFEESHEFENSRGFGFFQGKLKKFNSQNLDVPHMGWSTTHVNGETKLLNGLSAKEFFYYVHSYRLAGSPLHNYATASCDYDGEFVAVIEHENLFGTQFHPEKSHDSGLKLLENFIKITQEYK